MKGTEGFFDKVVFDHMEKMAKADQRAVLNVAKAEEEMGLPGHMIVRGIQQIRAKGYPVVSNSHRRTWENDFKMPRTLGEYQRWRETLVQDIQSLNEILSLCDEGARRAFGDVPVQGGLFDAAQTPKP